MTLKEKVVVLIGPTAVGKTNLSIELAKKFDGEIISGDSMQIYKGMDIATAKISKEEMQGVPHHLIDILEPDESFSVAQFQELVRKKITEITSRGKVPFIVGGTGLYIQAVLYDYQFQETATDTAFRTKLEEMAQAEGTLTIHDMLNKVDSEAAAAIHHHNVRRVIRALEVFHVTGRKMSDIQREQKQESLYDSALIGLTMERNVLYERINKRVEQMLEIGLLEEVQHFYEKGIRDCQSLQAIGYKEIYKYYDGLLSLEDSIEELKQNSRRYAKRQLTWFRNKMNVQWFDMTESVKTHDITKNLQEISSYLEGMLKIKSNT
ncbi:tRNA (adenosine(37)-N6)-dimethylallyltransferase MiaA [Niallia sp. FSL W8-0635]|uniref:tRNA (adenosine(37)-N6)-dimethylallyltransferase MiaA n=1 Tax=Niallia sp. FSL W8-0635 TaxID=2975337 RepID=UPI0009CD2E6E|nr:tRNA delta(2)-isopentenylpyrophosphate transferase [Mycobacteroides abscessus subsp. abscessus]HEO8418417.1 tRNA (adenosine(37)-N6)-dimethylallyltransferase MiaA [Yersinia enterocolitica]